MKQKHKNVIYQMVIFIVCSLLLMGCAVYDNTNTQIKADVSLAQQASVNPVYETKTYVNTKHSFTFVYPKMLHYKKEYQDKDGMYFMNEDASLLVWGSENTNHAKTEAKQMMAKDSYSIQKYDKNELRYCVGTKEKNSTTIYMQFIYPIDMEDVYGVIAEELIQEIAK